MLNVRLAAAISSIMSSTASTQFLVSVKFYSSTNQNFTFTPLYINSLTIRQDFLNIIGDDIVTHFPISSYDYAALYSNIQDLYATITFQYIQKDGTLDTTKTNIIQTYRAILIDPTDPTKELTDVASRTTPDRSIEVRFIEDTIYGIRHLPVNGIFHSAPMVDVCRTVCSTYGISTLQMATADNPSKYDHVILPPTLEFSTTFQYLQKKYGIYMCGVNAYYSSGAMHIYAPFDTCPTHPYTLSIYQSEEGSYSGSTCFHTSTGTNLKVVVNRKCKVKDLSLSASENHGTGFIFTRSSQMVDGVVSQDDKGNVTFNNDVSFIVRLNNVRLSASQKAHLKFTKVTDNPWYHASKLIANQALIMMVDWPHAVPFSVFPGMLVKYYCDESGKIGTRTGIAEGARFDLVRGDRGPLGFMYNCSGTLKLRMSLTETISSAIT